MNTGEQSYHQQGSSMPSKNTIVYIPRSSQFNGFNEKSIRSAFVAKVYSIVGCQLLFSLAILALVMFHEPTKVHMKEYGSAYSLIGLLGFIVVYLILVCVDSARRTVPTNYILVSLLTIFLTLSTAAMSVMYDTFTVMCAVGVTAVATLVIVFMASCCPFDITGCGCALYILGLVHIIVSAILISVLSIYGYASLGSSIVAALGAFLFSLYLLYDLQLIMGGRKYELSPEEYMLAAILVYVDIIILFQSILIMFGNSN